MQSLVTFLRWVETLKAQGRRFNGTADADKVDFLGPLDIGIACLVLGFRMGLFCTLSTIATTFTVTIAITVCGGSSKWVG